jgi:tripartite-type tricarboxylate transporter receptor subunit TctC
MPVQPLGKYLMRNPLLLVVLLLAAPLCHAADVYPNKAVRVVIPFSPGGTVDITGRLISQPLSEQLGKPFVVDNRTGASGTIANGLVARAAPDGYTLMIMDTSTTIVPGLFKSLPFDVEKDFAAISQIIRAPEAFVVHPTVNVSSLKEFVALAQASPGKLNYGSAGPGGAIHLSAELFKIAAKVNITHIPYKGGGEAMAAVLGGQVQMLLTTIPTVLPHVNSGRVRALAVTTEDKRRSPALPDVPSMAEAGVSGMTVYLWFGLVGPAGMPRAVVNKLRAEVQRALALPELRERFVALGGEVVGNTPEEFTALIRSELQLWARVIKAAGIPQE